ncbi:hypothetical protein [Parvularcula oceani]|uniref:hypothetical protein n=1 Tax=Parvularcula oceani TaxID=1247963 RepID=UPI0004E0E82E|nr:hypothetical protein [Parvularcula oceani]
MSDNGYQNTVSGLLRKRAEKLDEAADLRARMAVVQNDVEAIERVLETLGYDGELPTVNTRQARVVLFYRNELRSWLKAELRERGPATSRELAERMVSGEGKDPRDARLVHDLVKRIGKALRTMRDAGLVTSERTKVGYVWEAKP